MMVDGALPRLDGPLARSPSLAYARTTFSHDQPKSELFDLRQSSNLVVDRQLTNGKRNTRL